MLEDNNDCVRYRLVGSELDSVEFRSASVVVLKLATTEWIELELVLNLSNAV
uniref:Uncharacterized protein n=1 Tax=Octopus bimaculoides TaxID=37653 RepID=A0A0L8H593_OCTBM